MDGALVWGWVILLSVCGLMLKENLEVLSPEHKRKHEVVRFNGKSLGLGVRGAQVLLQLCC